MYFNFGNCDVNATCLEEGTLLFKDRGIPWNTPRHPVSTYKAKLARSIRDWMKDAQSSLGPSRGVRAIIGPHAGYSYCGRVLAYAYAGIDPHSVKRVFLLGPSHHVYTTKCMLSPNRTYRTPLGDLPIDQEVYSQLKATGQFEVATPSEDEDEHSLEMHCPFIADCMRGQSFSLVPVIVGSISPKSEEMYGRMLAPYLEDPHTIFVISSDFCHWGARFQYTRYNPRDGPIYKSIEALDRAGMAAIETGDPATFGEYLKETQNTICGRHAIGILLQALKASKLRSRIQFTQYAQSSACTSPSGSSVSYAAALVTVQS